MVEAFISIYQVVIAALTISPMSPNDTRECDMAKQDFVVKLDQVFFGSQEVAVVLEQEGELPNEALAIPMDLAELQELAEVIETTFGPTVIHLVE